MASRGPPGLKRIKLINLADGTRSLKYDDIIDALQERGLEELFS